MGASRLGNWIKDAVIATRPIGWMFEVVAATITVAAVLHLLSSFQQWVLAILLIAWIYRGLADMLIQQSATYPRKKTRISDDNVYDYYGG